MGGKKQTRKAVVEAAARMFVDPKTKKPVGIGPVGETALMILASLKGSQKK